MQGYTQKEVAKITGLTARQVRFLTDEEIVMPSVDPGKGRGKVRRYSKVDIWDFLVVRELISHKIKPQKIKQILNYLQQERESSNLLDFQTRNYLVISREGKPRLESQTEIFNLLRDVFEKYPSAIVVNLHVLMLDVPRD